MEVEWRPLKVWVCSYKNFSKGKMEDWGDLYEISNNGEIRDVQNKINIEQKIRKDYPYYSVALIRNGKKTYRLVHRCVATTFTDICGNYFEHAVVNHLDENKLNNTANNLQWVTYEENIKYGTAEQRRNENYKKAMEKRKLDKLKESEPQPKIWQIATLINY